MKIQYIGEELMIFESSLYRTTTSLLIGEEYVLLVDPNWLPIELEFIEKQIELKGQDKEKYLLFTHSDYDHLIGYGKFKEYTTIASINLSNNKHKERVMHEIQKFDDEYYIKRGYAIEYPRIDISICKESESLQLGRDIYQIYQAKGHNKDGIITHNITKGIVIAGDYLSNIEFPYIYDSWENYMHTLSLFEKLIQDYPVHMLIPGHGDYTSDKDEIKRRIEDSENYLMELMRSITHQEVFDEEKLLEQYDFPMGMKQFHQNNIVLMKKEIENK